MNAQYHVVVVIPVYRNLVAYERVSLEQCLKVLGNHQIVLVTAESIDVSGFLAFWPFEVERFADDFFTGTESYSRLLLSKDFYLRFNAYEYLLICQLDAFVFSDRLLEFCQKGYDYIGAPVPRWAWSFHQNRVGNGGFSLRKVASCLRVLSEKPPEEMFADRNEWLPEDHYFAMCAEQEKLNFRVPSLREAMDFSVDYEIFHCYRKLPDWLPFACHAWQKKLDVWQGVIESFGYQVVPDGTGRRDSFYRDVLRNYVFRRLCRQESGFSLAGKAVRDTILPYGPLAFWGYGKDGQRWRHIFQMFHIPMPLIFDRSAEESCTAVMRPSREVMASCGRMILITSVRYVKEIAQELQGYGLEEGKDFMDVRYLLDEIGVRYYRAIFGTQENAR